MNVFRIRWKLITITLISIATIILIFLVGWLKHQTFKKEFITKTQRHMLTISKTTAIGIDGFIQDIKRDLKSASKIPEIQDIAKNSIFENPENEAGYHVFSSLFTDLDNRINAFYLLNAKGFVLDRVPYKMERIGVDYSDKPGVTWVLKNHIPYVTGMFQTQADKLGISVLYPVFKGHDFVGILRAVVFIDRLYKNFIQTVKTDDQGYMFLMGSDGRIYYHPEHHLIGKTLQSISTKSSDGEEEQEQNYIIKMLEGREGFTDLVFDELSNERLSTAWSYVSINPKPIGSAGIKIKYDGGPPDIIKNRADVIAFELDRMITTSEDLTDSSNLKTAVKNILKDYPDIIEITIHGPRSQYDSTLVYKFSTSPGLEGKKSDPEDIEVIDKDTYYIRFIKQNPGRPHAGEDVIDITIPIHINQDFWSLVAVQPFKNITEEINKNMRDILITLSLMFLVLIASGLILFRAQNQKAVFETKAKDLEIITRKTAELQQQSQLITNMFESLPFPFYLIDANDYTIQMANSATGFCDLSLKPKCYSCTHSLSSPCSTNDHQCPLEEVKKTKKPVSMEHIHYKNGEARIIEVHGYPVFDDNNNIVQMIEYGLDITTRKQDRIKLEKALEEAKQGEKVKTLFMANMSHEIRTPLNAILGFTELIESSTRHLVGEEEQEFFNTIKNSGQRLMHTVHEVLDISQIEAGTYNFKMEKLDLHKLILNIINACRPMADQKGLKLTYESDLDSAFIEGDLNGLTQSISNIIDNAIKYTNEGSITVSLIQNAKNYLLKIKDTGIGIADEYIANMFNAFSQESEGYTKKFQGIGLGMAITKRHLDLNNVALQVKSTKGVGTTFILTFDPAQKPLSAKPDKKDVTENVPLEEPAVKPVILVMEDDLNSQNLMSFFLKAKYDICCAVSVKEAKQQLKKRSVDLILLDLSLVGNEDGLDLVRWMRKTKTWKQIPVIANTAHAFTSDRDNCMAAGCDDYLPKPIKRDKLLTKISKFI